MAELKINKVGLNGENQVFDFNGKEISPNYYSPVIALTSGTSFTIAKDASDAKMMILVQAGSATTLTFKGGDGPFAGEDFDIPVKAGLNAICIDSGRFKKGGVIEFTAKASVDAGVVEHY